VVDDHHGRWTPNDHRTLPTRAGSAAPGRSTYRAAESRDRAATHRDHRSRQHLNLTSSQRDTGLSREEACHRAAKVPLSGVRLDHGQWRHPASLYRVKLRAV
jgi:hypothetical protein